VKPGKRACPITESRPLSLLSQPIFWWRLPAGCQSEGWSQYDGSDTGQFAGAFYGEGGITKSWKKQFTRSEMILFMADRLSAGN